MRIASPAREVRHIGAMGEDLDAFLNTVRTRDEQQFTALERALHAIIPSFTGIDVNINNVGNVELRLKQGNISIPVNLLSDGTLRILGLLALGGAREQAALIGIEEPENGVHPNNLDLIALLLETRSHVGAQRIVTTHSPLLADNISHESLYVCRKTNEQTMIESFALWEYPEDNHMSHGDENLPELSVSERMLRGDFNA